MNVQEIQTQINITDYCDVNILDFQISFFGDEAGLYIYGDERTFWKIQFTGCFKVTYETDANHRKITSVKTMKKPQLGYYGQNIIVSESEIQGFYKVVIDLSIMNAEIICKNISVKKLNNSSMHFFWED